MSEKTEFRGDVAQAIVGNVHEAPRLSNVVNFTMTAEQKEDKAITDLQRRRISTLVKELSAKTGEPTLEIYKIILTEFGANKIREMPRDKYREVVAVIERWLTESEDIKIEDELLTARPSGNTKSINDFNGAIHCVVCTEKHHAYKSLQRMYRVQWFLSGTLSILCGVLLYHLPSPVTAEHLDAHRCYFDGRPYTAGSILSISRDASKECMENPENHAMYWSKRK